MAKCKFSLGFNQPIEIIIEKAKKEIASAGGTFEGDTKSGNYSVLHDKIKGNYKVEDNIINFEITDKPDIVSCKAIRKKIEGYISKKRKRKKSKKN